MRQRLRRETERAERAEPAESDARVPGPRRPAGTGTDEQVVYSSAPGGPSRLGETDTGPGRAARVAETLTVLGGECAELAAELAAAQARVVELSDQLAAAEVELAAQRERLFVLGELPRQSDR